MQIKNVQQAMRSHQNMNGFEAGGPGLDRNEFIGPGLLLEVMPECPSGGNYIWHEGNFPDTGVLMMRCSHKDHVPSNHEDW